MDKLLKAGGIAALFEALGYVIGFLVMALTDPGDTSAWAPAQKMAHLFEHPGVFHFWALFYYAFSVALVILAIALQERLKASAPVLMKITTPFALIWAGVLIASGMISQVGLQTVSKLHALDTTQAYTSWTAIQAVVNGLGGSVEVLGGVWLLLLAAALTKTPHRMLRVFSIAVGLAGVLTVIPQLSVMTAVFGLSQILWFIWIGVWLLRSPTQTAVAA